MRSEVKLDSNYYKLVGLPTQQLANQMASKVGQGSSEYGDLTNWSAWIQDDWQEGVGKLKPAQNGGFLYGEAESRVPNQLILPQQIGIWCVGSPDNSIIFPTIASGQSVNYITVGTGAYTRVGQEVQTSTSLLTNHRYWIYANIPPGTQITIAVYTYTGTPELPNTLVTSTTYTPPEANLGFYWHGVTLASAGMSTSTRYYVVAYPTSGTFQWAYSGAANGNAAMYNGSSWSTIDIGGSFQRMAVFANFQPFTTSSSASSGAGFFYFNSKLYCFCNNRLWYFAGGTWTALASPVITGITAVTGVTIFDSTAYFGNTGGDADYTTMNTSEAFTDTGVDGAIFAKKDGFLWRANANYVEYSSDGTTWEPTNTFGSPIYVSDTSDPVTGMCGMGDNMYVSTRQGLVCVFPGDVAKLIMPWGSEHAQNGLRMVNFQGSLYITVNGRVVRFTQDGAMQDVWMTRDDDVLAGRIGKVWDLEVMNNWLVALVEATATGGKPTIWAFQNESWHHIATLPSSSSSATGLAIDYDLYYDRTNHELWVIGPGYMVYSIYISDYSLNPYNDSTSIYVPSAWIEWDWFDGPILEARKDYDSVTIIGENFSSTCYAKVYWKDDDSTAWELLGTSTSNITELRWTLASLTRPNTKRFKLAVLLFTASAASTPRVRAIRVKYHLMVRDWYRWNLVVDCSGRSGAYQESDNGTRNTLTATQIKDAIAALAVQVPPFVYQDVDGKQYEVKVTDASFTYTKYEYIEATSTEWWEGTWSLVIEQVTQGTYS